MGPLIRQTEESLTIKKSKKSPQVGVESLVGGLIRAGICFPTLTSLKSDTHRHGCGAVDPRRQIRKAFRLQPARPKRWGHSTQPHFLLNCTADQCRVSCNNYKDRWIWGGGNSKYKDHFVCVQQDNLCSFACFYAHLRNFFWTYLLSRAACVCK